MTNQTSGFDAGEIVKYKMNPQLVRKDGSLWVASYQEESPMGGLFNRDKCYFFREVKRFSIEPKWWNIFQWAIVWRLRYTGKTHEGGQENTFGNNEFQLIKE